VTENLNTLEREVEQARAKFANDLAFLRSPQPYREFGRDLKSEARSVGQRMLNDLKARAAANPTAALAIGAGIAWKFLRDPPVATALIGAGVLSLWRTEPLLIDDEDYFGTAQERFGEQASQAAETIKDHAAKAVSAAADKAVAYAQSARETVEELASSVAEGTAESVESARDVATRIPEKAVNAAHQAKAKVLEAVGEDGIRDQLLLGVAGLAVVAALGLAYQSRGSELRERD
jgi:hypothetical protein